MFYCMPLSLKYVCYSLSTISQQYPICQAKKEDTTSLCLSFLVGVSGFEPEASWTRTMRDTKLRHTPMNFIYYIDRSHFLSSIFFLFLPQKICAFLLTKNRVGYNIKIKDDEGKKIGFSFLSESWRLVQDSRNDPMDNWSRSWQSGNRRVGLHGEHRYMLRPCWRPMRVCRVTAG